MTGDSRNNPSSLYEQSHYYHPGAYQPTPADDRAVYTVLSLAAGGVVGRAALGVLTSARLGAITRTASFLKRPAHTIAARQATDFAKFFGPSASTSFITRSLAARKRVGLALFGASLINPLENVHYARRRDWVRLGINYHLPIGGVWAYNRFFSQSTSSSPQTYQQDGGGVGTTKSISSEPQSIGKSSRPVAAKPGRRKKCGPGHYWSWKHNACVKSKFH